MPGRKKKTSRLFLSLLVLLAFVFAGILTSSSAVHNDSATSDIPDLTASMNFTEQNNSEEASVPESSDPTDNNTLPKEVTPSPEPSNREEDNEEASPQGTWIQETGGIWYYQLNNGYKTGWLKDNGHWYYFDQTGAMQIGWIKSQDRWFYLDEDGIMQTGWIQTGNKRYFLDEDGAMQTGWLEFEGEKYFLNPNGDMQTGWLQDDDQWYYFNANGTMATGWIVSNGKRYYLQDDGTWNPSVSSDKSDAPEQNENAMIALTYNGGPGMYTGRILDALEANNARATFFLTAEQIPDYPSVLGRMKELHCEMGTLISESQDLTLLTAEEIAQTITATDQALSSVTENHTTLTRLPGKDLSSAVSSAVEQPLILWSLDTKDEETKDISTIVKTVLDNVQDGDIILLHNDYETSAAASEILIPALAEKGYQMVTVSELANARDISMTPGSFYSNFKA